MVTTTDQAGSATGWPRILLRCEGLAVFAACLFAYEYLNLSWSSFALLFMLPDATMLGYLRDTYIGAAVYNAGHSYVMPMLLLAAAWHFDHQLLLSVSLIWAAHIGFDRALGYGLKYGISFRHTHLSKA
jgi:hypothetical protein